MTYDTDGEEIDDDAAPPAPPASGLVECPLCGIRLPQAVLRAHARACALSEPGGALVAAPAPAPIDTPKGRAPRVSRAESDAYDHVQAVMQGARDRAAAMPRARNRMHKAQQDASKVTGFLGSILFPPGKPR